MTWLSVRSDSGAKKMPLDCLEKQHAPLLKGLIVSEELELAALYGVLALVRHLQHPPGESPPPPP